MTKELPPLNLHPDWYEEISVPGVDPALPGIYEWRIEGVGCYIGQYTRSSRPRREYGKNVANIEVGRPYRKGNPNGFRKVHHSLHKAMKTHKRITLTIFENCIDKVVRNRREQALIALRRHEAEQGGLPVLNSVPDVG